MQSGSHPCHTTVRTGPYTAVREVTPLLVDQPAAPANPPATTLNPVTVTVGTQPAPVIFEGLTPTLAGLYQINFYVPQGIPASDQVPVTLATGGQMSAVVNLSLK